ncbi:hypothetical protein AWM68_17670 [Fictibacillus phosphorivorans]|uniref:Uncharacterized protein n=1 Tax=Fictibacillus phosphorivorans TaxID=1221500 RepID=A0A165NWZ4_9BACL|nr:hypothetical protein [Fictibacillus phosphorivorans]KZE68000.1 hypothetical protein AWM68_17670 [Fictibacillus phosphorivorans]
MKIQLLKDLVYPHKENLTTVKQWDGYAKEHGLPSSQVLIYNFGTWTEVKKSFSLSKVRRSSYTTDELKKIALEHKEHFCSLLKWDVYARKHGYPVSATYIKAFGSWSNSKKQIGITPEIKKSDTYSKEDIKSILKQHANNYLNRRQWDEYAKENKLPTYKTLKKHFEYDEILEIVNKKKTFNLTKEDLIQIAKDHKDKFVYASVTQWSNYAADKELPSSHKFINMFGSWRKAKNKVILSLDPEEIPKK